MAMHRNKKRKAFALWILTKMAMLFFIFALAGIMLAMRAAQEQSACDTQAQNVANLVAAKVTQLLFSPAEDERQALAFTSTLPVGVGGTKYAVNASYRMNATGNAYLSFHVKSLFGGSCSGSNSVSLGQAHRFAVIFKNANGMRRAMDRDAIQFTPSAVFDQNSALNKRSMFAMLLKCGEKRPGGREYLFVEDCREDAIDGCSDLMFDVLNNVVDACCGWNHPQSDCDNFFPP